MSTDNGTVVVVEDDPHIADLNLPIGEAQLADWYRHWIDLGLDSLEARLGRERETGKFCHGGTPGLADICLVPQLFNAMRFDKDPLTRRPVLKRIFEACMSLEAFDRAHPCRVEPAWRFGQ